jgi:hypothetical protein
MIHVAGMLWQISTDMMKMEIKDLVFTNQQINGTTYIALRYSNALLNLENE